MPTIPFQLPSGKIVSLTYCVEFPSLSSLYFQAARVGQLANWKFLRSDICRLEYAATSDLHKARSRLLNFDAVVAPPSTRPDAGQLKDWLIAGRSILDLSPRFLQSAPVEASAKDDPENSQRRYSYCSDENEDSFRSLFIIDDAIASGRTVDRILQLLKHPDMDQSNLTVEIAVWALLPTV